jgi:hypothetical protein
MRRRVTNLAVLGAMTLLLHALPVLAQPGRPSNEKSGRNLLDQLPSTWGARSFDGAAVPPLD